MNYVFDGAGVYVLYEKYAQLFIEAYKGLTQKEQEIITKVRVKGKTVDENSKLMKSYRKAVIKLADKIFEEDEDLSLLVYQKMLPDEGIKSQEDVEKFKVKAKKKRQGSK